MAASSVHQDTSRAACAGQARGYRNRSASLWSGERDLLLRRHVRRRLRLLRRGVGRRGLGTAPRGRPQRDGVPEAAVVVAHERRRAVGDPVKDVVEPVGIASGEVVQDVSRDQILVPRVADPDPNPRIVGAKVVVERAQAVVPGMATAALEPHLARREVELVVEYHDRLWFELEEACRLADRLARAVHVGPRLEQHDLAAAEPPFGDLALELCAPGSEAVVGGDPVHRHEPDVVPVAGIWRAGIAEADEKTHGIARSTALIRLFLPQAGANCQPDGRARARCF